MRRDRQRLLAHAVEEGAPLYRAIMHVFVTAADSYHLRLRVDDIAAMLEPIGQYPQPVTTDDLNYRLGKLCEWGNLHRDRDEALTTTLAEFETRGFVYDLTPGGEKAHLAIEDLDQGLQAVGGLQSTVLRRIVDLLVAGFRLEGEGPVATALRLHATAGLSMRLTLEQVLRLAQEQPKWPSRIFIVENPEVLSATVAELGGQHPPTMCTEGRPHRAADMLADLIIASGSEAYAHNDFDWDGLAINRALQERRARPWRMNASDLREAGERHGTAELPPLTGRAVRTPWDPGLEAALAQSGRELHEEDPIVLDALLADLRATSGLQDPQHD